MSDSFVQVAPDSTGKKIQTFEGTIGPDTVEAQSVVLVDSSLNAITEFPAGTASSSSISSVANSVTNVTLLSSTPGRLQATFYNDDTVANVKLKLGATATATSFTIKIDPHGYYELPQPVYTGVIDAIADSATGSMRITELS